MKKTIITLAALAGFASVSQAQNVRFGVKAGATGSISTMSKPIYSNVQDKFGLGAYAGGLAEISFIKKSDKFKLQVEALFNLTNLQSDMKRGGFNQSLNMGVQSVSVPLLAKYFFTPRFSLYAGPTANFNLGAKSKLDIGGSTTKSDLGSELNSFQLGGMVGVNYYVWKGLFVEAKFHAVMPDLTTPDAISITPTYGTINNISLGLGFKFK